MIPTRFKNTTGIGLLDFVIDMIATTESVFYSTIGMPGESFEAAMKAEATKGAWAELTAYLKAFFSTLFCIASTVLIILTGKGVGMIFSGMGVYAPPPPGVVV